VEDIIKGKFILDVEEKRFHTCNLEHNVQNLQWTPPPEGWCKLNIDGSFGTEGDAGAGIVVRDHNGDILLSSCRELSACRDALEAELSAVREGLSLTLHWCTQSIIVEVDCLEIINLVKNEELDRSVNTSLIEEIKTLLKVRQTCITHVKRGQNISSHYMANYARTSSRTAVWLASGPDGLAGTFQTSCIS
jgi:ribonuclease HI